MLRVHMSENGHVLYLGTPPLDERVMRFANCGHWRGDGGLNHLFLNSVLLSATQTMSATLAIRYSGLQLLCPLEDGFVFAAQKHEAGRSSHYIVGHVRFQKAACGHGIIADPARVTELLRMESFLSSQDFALDSLIDSGTSSWSNMPSAHQHHPRFSLSSDCKLLILAERDTRYFGPTVVNQLFLYRLPNRNALKELTRHKQQDRNQGWPTATGFLNRLETQAGNSDEASPATTPSKYGFARIPICLGILSGSICDLRIIKNESSWEAIVETDQTVRSWLLN